MNNIPDRIFPEIPAMSSDPNFAEKMNHLAQERIPFLFILDFDLRQTFVIPAGDIDEDRILYKVGTNTNIPENADFPVPGITGIVPPDYSSYSNTFNLVQKEIQFGNSYLLNLSFRSEIKLTGSLKDICLFSRAPYKLYLRDRFVLFSPESFVKIHKGRIYTYPMKGTKVKENEESCQEVLSDIKESAEHATITDLLRNDLAMVAKDVRVDRYRFIDEINTKERTILQVSSEISGDILPDYIEKPGDIFARILPAGSVTGAPKAKTIEIIKKTENYNRGFYTGVFGFFDGETLDSAVMIRFIEKEGEDYYYKSGGGITCMSQAEKEYREIIDKIYVPVY